MNNNTFRILAQDAMQCNDTWKTGLNNNDVIIGPPGAGKTRSYIKPNLLQCQESVIVTDTKGSLLHEVGPAMAARGYRVMSIDFADLGSSDPSVCGYNPLDYIRYNEATGRWSEQDIQSVAHALVEDTPHDPFWGEAARQYLACLIAYTLEQSPPEDRNLHSVMQRFSDMYYDRCSKFDRLMRDLELEKPDSYALRIFRTIRGNTSSEKTPASICCILSANLDTFTFDTAMAMYTRKNRVDFAALGRERTALFLTVSDTDRSLDRLVGLFYDQALHFLCNSADRDYPDHRLPVPVRFMLDDFAAGTKIHDFDNLTSVIRSREIYVSIVLQSLSQLNATYGEHRTETILNNCDNLLYLGGQDVKTAQYIAIKANKTVNTILDMPLGDAYLFTRGKPPRQVHKFDLCSHERYHELPEAAGNRDQPDRGI